MLKHSIKSILLIIGILSNISHCVIASSSDIDVKQLCLNLDTIHHVGDFFEGGIIFYVDESGYHGLICSLSNISKYLPVSIKEQIKKAFNKKNNQERRELEFKIISEDNAQNAKKACESYINIDYGTGIFNDWYLPSIDNLNLLFKNKDVINNVLKDIDQKTVDLLSKTYWSDTKLFDELFGYYQDWALDFRSGSRVTTKLPPPDIYGIRAIRTF